MRVYISKEALRPFSLSPLVLFSLGLFFGLYFKITHSSSGDTEYCQTEDLNIIRGTAKNTLGQY